MNIDINVCERDKPIEVVKPTHRFQKLFLPREQLQVQFDRRSCHAMCALANAVVLLFLLEGTYALDLLVCLLLLELGFEFFQQCPTSKAKYDCSNVS